MAAAPVLSPELTRQSIALARALAAAARNWGLYASDHPAVQAAVGRFGEALRDTGEAFAFAVTPETLLVAGQPLPPEAPVIEAAKLLHEHDLLQVTFMGTPPPQALEAFLRLLVTAREDVRARGGPERIWSESGFSSITIEQIDYEKLLEDRDVERPMRDPVWTSIVNAILQGQQEFTEVQQQRLLAISHNAYDIGELAGDTIEPKRNADGSPLITTQAATVLAVFRHLAGIVNVLEPERMDDVIRNFATATTQIDPHVVLQMMQMGEAEHANPIIERLAGAFDDETVAQLLATALGRDGKATARLAQVFDTIAPDESRKRRVLTMARTMLGEQDFGKTGQFRAVWSSMETLLLSYDETPYVSAGYQAALEGAGERADLLASRDLPEELPQWVETLEQDNVRMLSVMLVTDLLRIEEDRARAAEIAGDMGPLSDDLLMAGDFNQALIVVRALREAATGGIARDAASGALASIGASAALREAAGVLGDLDEAGLQEFNELMRLVGAGAVQALLPALQSEEATTGYRRASSIVQQFGAAAAAPLAPLADDQRWFVQRTAAVLLGGTRSPDAVPALTALLRRGDARVMRHAVSGLAAIDDPSAARALQTVLRTATGENRLAVIEALVAERDTRVVPMLARILEETDPFGDDHPVVLAALDAVRRLADERAVPAVSAVMVRKKWFAGRKSRAFKQAAVEALAAIRTAKARRALEEGRTKGDRILREVIRTHGAGS